MLLVCNDQYVYVHIYKCNYMYNHLCNLPIYIPISAYMNTYIYMCTCMYVHIYIYMNINVYVYFMGVNMCVHIQPYIYIYIAILCACVYVYNVHGMGNRLTIRYTLITLKQASSSHQPHHTLKQPMCNLP